MNIEDFRNHCLDKKEVAEFFPFNDDVLVFKVLGKIFALTSLKSWEEQTPAINLKCEPEKAILLREKYSEICPAYHMNKKHWNTVSLNQGLPDDFIKEMINESYELVVSFLPKKHQKNIFPNGIQR